MYATFAKEARKKRLRPHCISFEEVGKIEKEHEERCRKLLENVERRPCILKEMEI